MKKFFTLLMGAMMTVSASAATVYSWSSNGGNVSETGGVIEQVNDTDHINYPNKVGETTYYTVCLSGKKNGDKTYGSSNAYMLINLENPIAEGATLEIYAYRNKNTDAIGSIHMEFIDEDGKIVHVINEGNNRVWNNVHTTPDEGKTGNEEPNTNTYELPEETIGATKILLTRDQSSTNMFILSIKLTDQSPDIEGDTKVALISPVGEDDPLYFAIQDGFVVDFINSNPENTDETATLKQLQEYEAILVSNQVKTSDAIAPVLRSAVAYQPMVNLNAALIETWGLGTVTATESNSIIVSDENLENPLFAELAYDEGLELVAEGTLPIVTPGAYLANDIVLATIGDAPYILVHNSSRNAHILVPFNAEALTDGENMMGLVANALKVAAKTKKDVVKAAKPAFNAEQGNLETTVSISGPEASVIRYALGADAEVNAESTVYSDPILFKEVTIIKAVASLDGFLDSDVATYEVAIAAKADKPVITVTPGDGKYSTITIEAQDGAEIHYSFKGQAEDTRLNAAKTATYTEPLTVTEPTTIYAFATGTNLLPSDLEETGVDIPGINASNIRLDEVSHFSAREEWNHGAKYAAYVGMSDGVIGVGGSGYKAYSYYTEVVDHTEMVEQQAKDEEGNPKVDVNGDPVMETVEKNVYKVNPDSYFELTCEEEPDWKVVTEGQQLTFENVSPEQNVLASNGNCYETPFDLIDRAGTSKVLSFKGVGKNKDGVSDPSTGRVESAKSFAAPFDVVVYIRNNKPNVASVKIQTSTDGKEWSEGIVADAGSTQRTVKRTRYSVEGEGNYYVRVIHHKGDSQVQDIFIYNNGELSKEYTGVAEVIADEAAEVISVEYYNINGMRIAEPENGFYIMRATLSNGNVVVKKIVK